MAIANEASKMTGLRTSASSRLTVQELLNQAPLGNKRRVIILLGFLTMTLEGVEIGLWGFIYPQIVTQWGTSLATVTTMVTLGVVGLTVGSMVAGPLSDQIGRRLPIIVGTAGFGLATLGGALAPNDLTLGIFRVVACLFLGAVMPLVITLVAEFAPEKRKAAIVAITFTGFPLGTVITGFLASTIIPTLGWQWLLGTGTLLALILLPALLWGLPESTVFMIRRGGRTENVTKVLSAIIPGFDMKTVDLTGAVPIGGAKPVGGVRAVLSKKLVVVSLLIWL
jgi:MFS transporter, AAHS family, 4-hydroxybenzoate transporter